jgi:hypothetical protein
VERQVSLSAVLAWLGGIAFATLASYAIFLSVRPPHRPETSRQTAAETVAQSQEPAALPAPVLQVVSSNGQAERDRETITWARENAVNEAGELPPSPAPAPSVTRQPVTFTPIDSTRRYAEGIAAILAKNAATAPQITSWSTGGQFTSSIAFANYQGMHVNLTFSGTAEQIKTSRLAMTGPRLEPSSALFARGVLENLMMLSCASALAESDEAEAIVSKAAQQIGHAPSNARQVVHFQSPSGIRVDATNSVDARTERFDATFSK